jgi:hypothetical protein
MTLVTEREPHTRGVYAYCDDCHSPDGDGVGRCDYFAINAEDAALWYWVHTEEEHND